jgi:hypothetical protein
MTIDVSRDEAVLIIAILTFAEGAAMESNPSIAEALRILRPWRSKLLMAYLRAGQEPETAQP